MTPEFEVFRSEGLLFLRALLEMKGMHGNKNFIK